jgi:hypothetical protein
MSGKKNKRQKMAAAMDTLIATQQLVAFLREELQGKHISIERLYSHETVQYAPPKIRTPAVSAVSLSPVRGSMLTAVIVPRSPAAPGASRTSNPDARTLARKSAP